MPMARFRIRSSGGSSSRGNSGPVNDSPYRKSSSRKPFTKPRYIPRTRSAYRRPNYGPVNDSPWRNTVVRRKATLPTSGTTRRTTSTRSSSGSRSSSRSAPRSYTPPRPRPAPKPPPPPKPKKLSYNQLLAMVKNDPAMKALLAAYSRGEKLSKSQAAQTKGLFDTEYEGDLAALARGRDKSQEEAMEEAAAMGRLRSGVYGDRQQDILKSFEEGKGRLSRARQRGRLGVEQANQQALEQFRIQRAAARQAAIDRLLAQRSDIQRGY